MLTGSSAVNVAPLSWGSAGRWGASATAPPAKRATKRMKEEPAVIHSIFMECAAITTDPYWVNVFKKAAIGKMPPQSMFRSEGKLGQISYKRGSRIALCPLSENIFTTFTDVVKFFQYHAGMYSDADRESLAREEQETIEAMSTTTYTWATCARKKRTSLLTAFINTTAKSLRLTKIEKTRLADFIHHSILTRVFGKDNIVITPTGQSIEFIHGLMWDGHGRRFFTDLPTPRVKWRDTACPLPAISSSPPKTLVKPFSYLTELSNFLEAITRVCESKEVMPPIVTIQATGIAQPAHGYHNDASAGMGASSGSSNAMSIAIPSITR